MAGGKPTTSLSACLPGRRNRLRPSVRMVESHGLFAIRHRQSEPGVLRSARRVPPAVRRHYLVLNELVPRTASTHRSPHGGQITQRGQTFHELPQLGTHLPPCFPSPSPSESGGGTGLSVLFTFWPLLSECLPVVDSQPPPGRPHHPGCIRVGNLRAAADTIPSCVHQRWGHQPESEGTSGVRRSGTRKVGGRRWPGRCQEQATVIEGGCRPGQTEIPVPDRLYSSEYGIPPFSAAQRPSDRSRSCDQRGVYRRVWPAHGALTTDRCHDTGSGCVTSPGHALRRPPICLLA